MIASLLLAFAIAASSCQVGVLSQYSRGATERVITNRSVPQRTAYTLPDNWRTYDGLIAVADCARLGEVVTVTWKEHSGTFLVFDCSGHASTTSWMKRGNILGEIDWFSARRWHAPIGRGLKGARVCRVE